MFTIIATQPPKFPLGRVMATPGAIEACGFDRLAACLALHVQGDWGTVCTEDAAANDAALKDGRRLLSAYPIDRSKASKGYGENTVWIITEADRSATTFLLPNEY